MLQYPQYPHFLFAVVVESTVQDEDGNWSPKPVTPLFVSTCREESDGTGSELQVAGGTFHAYSSLIQLPRGAAKLDVGTSVLVANDRDGTDIRTKGKVLKFDAGRLHSRAWV
jgi:hypothetical protein